MPESAPDFTPSLFHGVKITPGGGLVADKEILKFEADLDEDSQILSQLLPLPTIQLTEEQALEVNRDQAATLLLDSAAKAPMRCSAGCYFIPQCPLAQIKKHPIGKACPRESQYVVERFIAWMREFGRTQSTLLESERVAISQLVGLQVELLRIRAILAQPEHSNLQQRSVRDVNAQDGTPIAWEDQIHIAAQREDLIIVQMRMIMQSFELTPEMKTRRKKALQIRNDQDLATHQSSIYDKLRWNKKSALPVIDVDPQQ